MGKLTELARLGELRARGEISSETFALEQSRLIGELEAEHEPLEPGTQESLPLLFIIRPYAAVRQALKKDLHSASFLIVVLLSLLRATEETVLGSKELHAGISAAIPASALTIIWSIWAALRIVGGCLTLIVNSYLIQFFAPRFGGKGTARDARIVFGWSTGMLFIGSALAIVGSVLQGPFLPLTAYAKSLLALLYLHIVFTAMGQAFDMRRSDAAFCLLLPIGVLAAIELVVGGAALLIAGL